jgi:hypothetical protein
MSSAEVLPILAAARAKLADGTLTAADLDALAGSRSTKHRPSRQRLLYLHAESPSVRSGVINSTLYEPVGARVVEIDPTAPPGQLYATVLDAIADGWRVVQFPDYLASFDDREVDMIGYEFILEKMEPVDG